MEEEDDGTHRLIGHVYLGLKAPAGAELAEGTSCLSLASPRPRELEAVLELRDGQKVSLEPCGAYSAGLLTALTRLHFSHGVDLVPLVHARTDAVVVAQVGVVLPATAWEHPGRWKASPHAVTVFNALKPLPPQASSSPAATAEQQGGEAREAAGQEEAGPVQQATQAAEVEMADPQKTPGNALGAASPGQAKDQGSLLRQQPQGDDVTKEILALEELHASPQASRTHYSLEAMFKELPSCSRDADDPPMYYADPAPEAMAASGASLHALPHELLLDVVSRLPPRDIASVSCTCRCLRSLSLEAVHGMRLTLFPHQRVALRWMLERESRQRWQPHPFARTFTCQGGLPIRVNLATGELQLEEPGLVRDVRGGMFCDEPGLGKTVTAMSLILKTRGCVAQPPPGAKVLHPPGTPGFYIPAAGSQQQHVMQPEGAGANGEQAAEGGSRDGHATGVPSPSRAARRRHLHAVHHSHSQPVPQPQPPPSDQLLQQQAAPMQTENGGASGVEEEGGVAGGAHGKAAAHRSKRRKLDEAGHEEDTLGRMQQQQQPPVGANGHGAAWEPGVGADMPMQIPFGFLRPGQERGHPANVHHFRMMLAQAELPLLYASIGPLSWLSTVEDPQLLQPGVGLGFKITGEMRQTTVRSLSGGYAPMLNALGLVNAEQLLVQQQQQAEAIAGGKGGKGRKGGSAKGPKAGSGAGANGTNKSAHTWFQASGFGGFEFDTEALRVALLLWERAGGSRALGESGSLLPRVLHGWEAKNEAKLGTAAATLAEGSDGTRVYLSAATLVVVPPMLVQHWREQLMAHVAPGCLRVCEVVTGEEPPPIEELAWDHDVVITTFQRLTEEWQPRSAAGRLALGGGGRRGSTPLLTQIHWLRIILDEGHTLGGTLSETNRFQVACALHAERRWVMTGTPTPSSGVGGAASSVAHLQPLLAFLHQHPYGTQRKGWEGAIARRLEACAPDGRARVLELLRTIMIRAVKADLRLKPLHRTTRLLDFAPEHASSYNSLVEVVQRNLLLADFLDPNHRESLMFHKASKWAREMIGNVRMSCCVAGSMNLVVKEEDLGEALGLLAERLSVAPPHQAWEEFFRAQQEEAARVQAAAQAQEQQGQGQQQQEGQEQAASGMQGHQQAGGAAEDMDTDGKAGGPAAADAAGSSSSGAQGPAPPASANRPAPTAVAAPQPARSLPLNFGRVGGEWLPKGHPLKHVEEGLRHGTACQICSTNCKLPIVTPCGHLGCVQCIATSRTHCPLPSCRQPYRMQAVDDPERRKTNEAPQWEVPLELIEWQPVYHQEGAKGLGGGEWSANWQITRSTRCVYLLKRLREVGGAPNPWEVPPPLPPASHHTPALGAGVVGPVKPSPPPSADAASEAGQACGSGGSVRFGEPNGPSSSGGPSAGCDASNAPVEDAAPAPQPSPSRAPDAMPEPGSQSQLEQSQPEPSQPLLQQPPRGILKRTDPVFPIRQWECRNKCIVFSQFWVHLQLIGQHLAQHGVPHVVLKGGTDMKQAERDAAINRFSKDPGVGVLLMNELGAVGLDLSFVTYVFLMEPLADRSLEQQIVSRAHRMGAKKDVYVELLAMRNTAEEGMLRDMGLLPGGQYQNQQQQQQPAGFGSRALPSSSNQSSGTEGRVEQGASAQQQPEGGASAMEVDGSGEGEEAAKPEEAAQEEAAAEGRRGRRGGRGGGGQGPGGAPRVHSAAQAAQEQADARKRFFLGLRKVEVSNLPEYQDLDDDRPPPSTYTYFPRLQPAIPRAAAAPSAAPAAGLAVTAAASPAAVPAAAQPPSTSSGAAQLEGAAAAAAGDGNAKAEENGGYGPGAGGGVLAEGAAASSAAAPAPAGLAQAEPAAAQPPAKKKKGVRFADGL